MSDVNKVFVKPLKIMYNILHIYFNFIDIRWVILIVTVKTVCFNCKVNIKQVQNGFLNTMVLLIYLNSKIIKYYYIHP